MKKITHMIVGLGNGGAENMLFQVLKYGDKKKYISKVISFGSAEYYGEKIEQLGFKVRVVNLKSNPISSIVTIIHELKDQDTVCCWMYHANLIGFFTGTIAGVNRIIWCIRHSNLDRELNSRRTLKIIRFCAKISQKVSVITYNGDEARKNHEAIGYDKRKGIVLDNGCDCNLYCPDDKAALSLKEELGINEKDKIILSVTRDHPIKDIPTFIKAFSMLHLEQSNTVAVMCGVNVSADNAKIVKLCRDNQLEVGKDIYLLGMRNDVERLLAACDLFVLHSAGEAFPNTLIQAMSCECLCLATDVGDVRKVIGNDNQVISPRNANELLHGMKKMLNLDKETRDILKVKSRNRVISNYSIQRVIKQYEDLY